MTPIRIATLASPLLLAACAPVIASNQPYPGPPPRVVVVENGRDNSRQALGVPPGHMPRPGECRIWLPGIAPGHQPRDRSCEDFLERAPAGSMILYRPSNDPSVVHVHYVDENRPGVIVLARVYAVDGGAFVREENAGDHHDDDDDFHGKGKGHGHGRGHDRDG